MTQQMPPTEPLDDQERELARIIRALPGGDPPATLDARILKAATNAAAASRRPRSRWLASAGAMWGIGGAAAAVLALGVSWQMMLPTQRPASANSAPVMPEPFAGEHLDEHVAVRAEAGTSADSAEAAAIATEAAASAKVSARQEQAQVGAAQPTGALAADAAQGRASVAAGRMPKATPEISRMKPSNWLAHIRQLRKDNRTAEARASLLEFRKRYPDFVIPADLAALLRE